MSGHTERAFETAIEAGLTSSGGYEQRSPHAFDEALALFPDDVSGFLKGSQPAKWEALQALLGPKTAATVLDSLSKELGLKGTLHVLRHGFKCYGKTFRMAYFRPNTRMNPEAAENYAKNRLTITRQVAFTSVMKNADGKNRRCIIDVTLAVNGIPVVTAELKNSLTGQRAARCGTPVRETSAPGAICLFRFQEARPGPLRGGPGQDLDDDAAQGQGNAVPALQPRQQPRGRQPAGRGATGRPTTCGTRCYRSTASWTSCNASCTWK